MKITIDIDEREYRILINALKIHGNSSLYIVEGKVCNDSVFSLQDKVKEAWKGSK